MAGFNYSGGYGDGTGWSSERGSEPSPGGGQQGNAGNRDNNGTGKVSVGFLRPSESYDTSYGKVIVNA